MLVALYTNVCKHKREHVHTIRTLTKMQRIVIPPPFAGRVSVLVHHGYDDYSYDPRGYSSTGHKYPVFEYHDLQECGRYRHFLVLHVFAEFVFQRRPRVDGIQKVCRPERIAAEQTAHPIRRKGKEDHKPYFYRPLSIHCIYHTTYGRIFNLYIASGRILNSFFFLVQLFFPTFCPPDGVSFFFTLSS